MAKFVAFGEVMARVDMPAKRRFRQALPGPVEVSFAGAEANVVAFLALAGESAALVSALPRHEIADACLGALRDIGVDTGAVARRDSGRLGLYFVEEGANQRPSKVIYDRAHSTISETPPSAYDWDAAFRGASWFHVTGITPSLSEIAAEASLGAVKAAKAKGLTVSCDLNFRKNLWRWEEGTAPAALAGRTMRGMLPFVDVLIGNEEDAHDVLGISASGTDVNAGSLNAAAYEDVASRIVALFPNIGKVAFTLRQSLSASHNRWGAMLYDSARGEALFAPTRGGAYSPYDITDIVDRIGGGDSFSAALVYALAGSEFSEGETALRFAAAASCLNHSIRGDFNYSSVEEIVALMNGDASGRVRR